MHSIQDYIKELNFVETIDDAWYMLCKISLIYELSGFGGDIDSIDVSNILFCEILENDLFKNSINIGISLYIENSYEESQDDIFNGQLIKLLISIVFFPLSQPIENMSEDTTFKYRNYLGKTISQIRKNLDQNYKIETIIGYFSTLLGTNKYNYNDTFPWSRLGIDKDSKLDGKFLFNNIKKGLGVGLICLLQTYKLNFISASLKKYKDESLSKRLGKLNGSSTYTHNQIQKIIAGDYDSEIFNAYLKDIYCKYRTINELVISEIVIIITNGFNIIEKNSIHKLILNKSHDINIVIEKVENIGIKYLSAFTGDENKSEWSNKIFIVSIELLQVVRVLSLAKDDAWKATAMQRAYAIWIDKVNEVINKYDIEDDRDIVETMMDSENNTIERKSSFFIRTQSPYINEEIDKRSKDEGYEIIVKNIIGMINSNGGNIVVGLIEKPNQVKHQDVLNNQIIRDEKTFFDVGFELEKFGMDIDSLTLELAQRLSNKTREDKSDLDQLWDIKTYDIVSQIDYRKVSIYIIEIRNSEKKLCWFENDSSIKIPIRINRETIFDDPRKYLI